MNNILKFTLVLFLVNFVASSILAGVYQVTKVKIEEQKKMVKEKALKEVMPESGGIVFTAKKYGYSGIIETMVGMKKDGTITGVRVLSQNETPGLGAKIVEVVSNKTVFRALNQIFSKEKKPEQKILPYFTEQFKGKNVRNLRLSENGIQAITGATISSKAVVDSIREEGVKTLNK